MPSLRTPTEPATVGRSIAGLKAAPPAWPCGCTAGVLVCAAADVLVVLAPPLAAAETAGAEARQTVMRPNTDKALARKSFLFRRPPGLAVGLARKEPAPLADTPRD